MKIGVIGVGYVGLTLACLAEFGNNVLFVGRSADKINNLKKGILPVYEKGLSEIVKRNLEAQRIDATTDYEKMKETEIIFICVGTPSAEGGAIDISQIKTVSERLGILLKNTGEHKTIVVKSTVVPGTTKDVVIPILEKYSGKKAGGDFSVCMNPEFLREGDGVYDFLHPDKVVIGGYDEKSSYKVIKLYSFYDSKIPRIVTNLNTAEMVKYAQNAALATRISFINEIANICEKFEVDAYEVSHAIGLDSRIGPKFLNAGPGFGGSCFPKDVKALVSIAKTFDVNSILLDAVLTVNKTQPHRMVGIAKSTLGSLNGKKIAVLGLAFKADTDDIREASSIPIINSLLKENAIIKVYDPQAMENSKKIFGKSVGYCTSKEDCIKDADLCMIITEWDEFRKLDLSAIKCPIIDGRRVLDPIKAEQYGLVYKGIGWKNN